MADEHSAKTPIPTDEIASLAGLVLAKKRLSDDIVKAGVPVAADSYNELLSMAKRLAGFVLNADPHEGSNVG
jgi:hypothetical protein